MVVDMNIVAPFAFARKLFRPFAFSAALLALAACDAGIGGAPLLTSRDAIPVALLVPQSDLETGAVLASSLENAARLAISDLEGVEIDLRVYDTGGSASGATNAAMAAVGDGAKVILGPVFAEAANAAGGAVANRGVNVLAFSNNPAIAGGNVFILGNTFQSSANRLMRYANGSGRNSVYVVHAANAAEMTARDAVQSAIAQTGAQLAGTYAFELSQQGVINALPEIADGVEASGANAIVLTSGTSGALPLLAELLPENGVTPPDVQYIGLQRLDIPATALSLKGVQEAWFALPDPGLSNTFAARYSAAFGQPPHPIAGLAYDGIAAIGALAASGESSISAAALTQPSGFVGTGGVFRLRGDGTNERGLAVATIQNNQVVILDPAPRSFSAPGL